MNKDLLQTIIAITLSAIAALMAGMLIGDFWRDAPAKAEATTMLNEGTQIVGANDAYYMDNFANASTVDDLVPSYLKDNPDTVWAFNGTSGDLEYVDAAKDRITGDVCQALEAIFTDDKAATVAADATGFTNRTSHCVGDDTNGYTLTLNI